MVAATSACLRSHVGMYLCSYLQVAFGKQAKVWTQRITISRCPSFRVWGPFWVPLAALFFSLSFFLFFCIFARFWVPFLGPFLVPKSGPRNRVLIGSFVVGPKLRPIFGSIVGTHFWAPDFDLFSHFFWNPGVFFFQRLELAAGLLRTYSGPKLFGPLVTNFLTHQHGGGQGDFGYLCWYC